MKKFTFKIEVIVYGDSEDEAKTTFCEDPNSWEFDESDLTLVSDEDCPITIEPPGEPGDPDITLVSDKVTTSHTTLVSTAARILEGMSADDRVILFQEIAGDYCIHCGFKNYGGRCYCMDCS